MELGNVTPAFTRSKGNLADGVTKPVGKNIFSEHYSYNIGGQPIPRVHNLKKTVENDTLPCPHCSLGLLGRDYQLEGEY